MAKLTINDLKTLSEKLLKVQNNIYYELRYKNIAGGWVDVNLLKFTKKYYHIEIKDGIDGEGGSTMNRTIAKIDRKTLELIFN